MVTQNKKRILIAEDNSAMRAFLVELLSAAGHQVSEARTTDEALEVAARAAPDIVVADLHLGGSSAWTFPSALRARSTAPVRMVAISGSSGEDVDERARCAGFDTFLAKPFDGTTLLDELTKLIGEPPRRT